MKKDQNESVAAAIEIAIKFVILGIILYVSYLILKPFLIMIIWGIILAVALSPLVERLTAAIGSRKVVVLSLIAVVILALIIPSYHLSGKIIESGQMLSKEISGGDWTIPAPTEQIKEWPLFGESIYELWKQASVNLMEVIKPYTNEIKQAVNGIVFVIGSLFETILVFFVSLILAAFFLIGAKDAAGLSRKISTRLMGEKGDEWMQLTVLTIRSVVMGVVGVAAIQSTLAYIGFALMGIPYAPLLGLAVLFLAIIQLPAFLVIGPTLLYVFSQGSGTSEFLFLFFMMIVGAADNILKPLLMGRGVNIPMLVILVGAIGGMLLMGIIGLFIGAVILALAYKLFELWLEKRETHIN